MSRRSRKIAGAAALAAVLLAQTASAQQTGDTTASAVRPGDGTVDGRGIRPHTHRWLITYFTPDGRPVPGGPKRVATWYDTVRIITLAGHAALHRKQVLLAAGDAPLEVIDSWAEPRSLAPIRTVSQNADGTTSLREYRGAHVTGYDPDSAAPGGRKSIDTTLAVAPFDFFGGMYDLLLAGFPLRDGYRARFPADLGGARGGASLEWVTIAVASRDTIDTGTAQPVPAWHVVTGPTSVGRFEFWIGPDPRYMVRMWYIGPRGGKQVWTTG